MRVKTSISIPEEKLAALDALIGPGANRSRAIERAIDELIARLRREARDRNDLEIYSRFETEFASEVAEVLTYQTADPFEDDDA